MARSSRARYRLDDVKAIPPAEVAQWLGLGRRGKRFFCPACQPTGGKRPDLAVADRGFLCFKCSAYGSSVDLVMLARGVDLPAAIQLLGEAFKAPASQPKKQAQNRGIQGSPASRKSLRRHLTASEFEHSLMWVQEWSDFDIYGRVLELAPVTESAIAYLRGRRGLTDQVITDYRLGHVIEGVTECQYVFEKLCAEFSDDELRHSGVVKGNRLVWWSRVMLIPYVSGAKVTYLQGRQAFGHPKYVNVTGAPRAVYNLMAAARTPAAEPVYICEDVFDALAIIADGKVAVAAGGTANADVLSLLPVLRHRRRVIIARQNDEPSQRWAQAITRALADIGKRNVQSLVVPEGFKDLCDYLASQRISGEHRNV